MKYVCLALLCALHLLNTAFCQEHTIITPKAFRIGATENVILNLHGYTSAVVSSYSFIVPSRDQPINHIERFSVGNEEQAKLPIVIPVRIPSDAFGDEEVRNPQFVEFNVEVIGSDKDFVATFEVLLSKESGYLFIFTDRPIYRPSETVRYNVFPLVQRMAPERDVLFRIIIRTPDGIGVHRTNPRLLSQQLQPYSDSYELPDYPEIGNWIIEAIYTNKGYKTSQLTTFRVDRYVLPTFQVLVEPSKTFFLLSDVDFEFTITAEYSYGEKVGGAIFFSVFLKKSAGSDDTIEIFKRPSSVAQELPFLNGRGVYSVPRRSILEALPPGESLESIANAGGSLIVEAAVNGLAEGVIEKATSREIPFLYSPFKIDLSRLSNFYTPSLNYEMQFDIVDAVSNAPLNVDVDITCNGVTEPSGSDERGQVNFLCTFEGDGNQNVHIATADPRIADADQASADLVIEPYRSPSGSYLQVDIPAVLEVAQRNVFITFRFNRDIQEIRYQILSRGTIVTSGVTDVGGGVEATQNLDITAAMVPSARVVAYYMYKVGNNPVEVVSNSKWFDIVDRCGDEVTVDVVEDKVEPGDSLNIRIQGAPNGVVVVTGVDRAAYFLYSKGRLTRDTMFKKMESYDQGCIRSGGRDAQSVFERAGVLMTTSEGSPSVQTLSCDEPERKKRQIDEESEFERNEAKSVRDLARCERDGARPFPSNETCKQREARVKLNARYQDVDPRCAKVYLDACVAFEAQMSDSFSPSGRSAGSEDAEIQALVDLSPRTNFQENLFFTVRNLAVDGTASFFQKASDSITTYEIDAYGMADKTDGFCISKPDEVTIFKDIFIQIFTPYSLRELEQADVRITVFNYGIEPVNDLLVQVRHDSTFCSSFSGDEFLSLGTFRVRGQSAVSTNIALLPLAAGVGSITVRVVEKSRRSILDTIVKQIIVEPPGEIKYIDGTQVVDFEDGENGQFEFDFNIQDNFTPGTRQCWIYAYADLLGPSIQADPITQEPNNVAELFRQPSGCGEQNMLRTAPNIYVHAYLDSVGMIPEGSALFDRSIDLMEQGLARELDYRTTRVLSRPWSVFKHYNPSTWLNAFVNKVFTKAKQFDTDLDVTPICASIEWMLTQQQDDGHFAELQRPLHKEMHGAVGGSMTLTAYVVISLLETDSVCSDEINRMIVIAAQNAVNYLRANKNADTFTDRPFGIALLSYALNLHEPNSAFALEIYDRLLDKKIYSDERRKVSWKARRDGDIVGTDIHSYWYARSPEAVDIETSSYALLSILQRIASKEPNEIGQFEYSVTKGIAFWLICLRNADGAFFSTQDTVIGLQALAAYQTWSMSNRPVQPNVALNFALTGRANSSWSIDPHIFEVTKDEQNFRKIIPVPMDVIEDGGVQVFAAGEGQGQVSYKCVYRTTVDEESCHFNLDSNVEVLNERAWRDGVESLKILLTITVSKPVGLQADSSIVNVGLLSGFKATEASLNRIRNGVSIDGVVDRFEQTNQNIFFYLPEITSNLTIIPFELVQQTIVRRPQPAKITVYDYYEPSVQCGKFYSLDGNFEELRTTGCGGEGDEDMCKCAEGECPVCRTRNDQLNNTVCLRATRPGDNRVRTCNTCPGDSENCVNIFTRACQNNFVYIVSVTSSPQLARDAVFTSFEGTVKEVIREGEEPEASVRNENRKFDIRDDCYRACQDPDLPAAPGFGGNFIEENFDILVMGNNPEKVTRDGVVTRNYIMKRGAVMERVIPDHECTTAQSYIKATRCNNSRVVKTDEQLKQCADNRKINTACRNLIQLKTRLATISCD